MASFQCAADMKHLDMLNLATCIRNLEVQGVDELHFDVADGRFVPQYGVSAALLRAVKAITDLPCHAHLLVEQPDKMLPAILDTGVDIVSIHVETCTHVHRALSLIRDSGRKAGIALAPATALTKVNYCLPMIDRLVLLGTDPVHPAPVLPRGAMERIRILADNIRYHEYPVELDVEGVQSVEDAARCARFGARRIVGTPEVVPELGTENAEGIAHFLQQVEVRRHTV